MTRLILFLSMLFLAACNQPASVEETTTTETEASGPSGYDPELAKELRQLENLSRQHDQTQLFIETPYRAQMVLEVALQSLQPDTVFGIAQDLTGMAEFNRALEIAAWRKLTLKPLEKLPAVFLLYKPRR